MYPPVKPVIPPKTFCATCSDYRGKRPPPKAPDTFFGPRVRPTGEHQRGNARQIGTLLDLRNLGNIVLVVEHDEAWWRGTSQIQAVGGGGPVGLAAGWSGTVRGRGASQETL